MNLSAEWTSMTDFANKPPALDLKAVEARIQTSVLTTAEGLALLALLRETREKARAVIIWTGSTGWSDYPEPVRHFIEELAAVLAKATEGLP